jgi:hypothetical protein
VDTVKALTEGLGDYEVEYAFFELSEQHPYLIFDKTQNGVVDFAMRRCKGAYAPKRSSTLQLSNRDMLLCLTGPSEVKRPEDGMPRPLLLTVHRESSFTDMTYLTRKVFAFSNHSWGIADSVPRGNFQKPVRKDFPGKTWLPAFDLGSNQAWPVAVNYRWGRADCVRTCLSPEPAAP